MMLSSIVTLSPNSRQLLCLISALFALHVRRTSRRMRPKNLFSSWLAKSVDLK